MDKTLTVFVVSEKAGEKAVAGLELTDKPKVEYIVGEAFEKKADALQLSLMMKQPTHALTDEVTLMRAKAVKPYPLQS